MDYRSNSPIVNATAAFLTGAPLTDDQIMRAAPAVFADTHSRSDAYAMVPTSAIVRAMRSEGFLPYSVQQAATYKGGDAMGEHSKHLIRFRRDDGGLSVSKSEGANEIILINSHNGSSAYEMMAGHFRFVCANGLISGSVSSRIAIPHMGDQDRVLGLVIEGATRVLDDFESIDSAWERFKSTYLHVDEQIAYAQGALNIRYEDDASPIQAEDLLTVRRSEDVGADLWTVFNRVQENMMRGGLRGQAATGRRVTTRGVTSIDTGVQLNRRLWNFTETVQRLVTA